MIIDWYDTETTGIRKDYDQILQLASVQTDEDLNIIEGSELNLIVKPKPDIIPHPKAFLTHKISINELKKLGIPEFELAQKVRARLLNGNTCIAGYNTLSYDDEMLRRLFFRNLQDPYEHEYKNFNSRFDAFKLVELCYAFAPDVLKWPLNEDGHVSLKLENLSEANGIIHENAHEAISDVYATIGIAKIIKETNPRLYQYMHDLKNKKYAKSLLAEQKPIAYVSSLFGKENHRWSLIQPIVTDKVNDNQVIAVDLRQDPSVLLEMSAEEIKEVLFTAKENLPADTPKLPILTVKANQLPPLVNSSKLIHSAAQRNDLDLDQCYRHAELLKNNNELKRRLQDVFTYNQEPSDTYASLYSGSFFSNRDSNHKSELSKEPKSMDSKLYNSDIIKMASGFDDKRRMFDLTLRAKWNTYLKELINSNNKYNPIELYAYTDWLKTMATKPELHGSVTLEEFNQAMGEERLGNVFSETEEKVMKELEDQVNKQAKMIKKLDEICQSLLPEIAAVSERNWEVLEECLPEHTLSSLTELLSNEYECNGPS